MLFRSRVYPGGLFPSHDKRRYQVADLEVSVVAEVLAEVALLEVGRKNLKVQSRDENYKLSLISGEDRLNLIKGMDVVNVINSEIEKL